MKTYDLVFEGRQRGAIGIFYKITHKVNAINEEKAKDKIREKFEVNGFYSVTDMSEYQGWTNSKTWNIAFLIEQDIKSNKYLESVARQGKVSTKEIKLAFEMRLKKLPLETWTIGKINYDEIAQVWNEKEWI